MGLEGVKRNKTKQAMMAAYELYLQEPRTLDNLFSHVIKFAATKVEHLEHDVKMRGAAETSDDWAQNIALAVWKDLPKFRGTPEVFYAWVHKICFNEAVDAFNRAKKEHDPFFESDGEKRAKAKKRAKKEQKNGVKNPNEKEKIRPSLTRVPLYVTTQGDDGEEESVNPALHQDDCRREWRIRLPESVQGVERRICQLLMDGKDYAEVGYHLNMTENAVKERLARLRAKMQKERRHPSLLV